MHDLHCKDAKEMYSETLAQRVFELKETEEGIDNMCEEMEKIYGEGEVRGELRKAQKTARLLASEGDSVEKIARVLSESETTIKKWLEE